jgi:hypothetical protein
MSADVAVRLLSGRTSVDGADQAGAILTVRADVAAAWIADGLAEALDAAETVLPLPPDPAARPSQPRRRGAPR